MHLQLNLVLAPHRFGTLEFPSYMNGSTTHKLLSQKLETLPSSQAFCPIYHCCLWPPFTEDLFHLFITEFRPSASLSTHLFTEIISSLVLLLPVSSSSPFSKILVFLLHFTFLILLSEFLKIEEKSKEENNSHPYSNHSELITVDIYIYLVPVFLLKEKSLCCFFKT